MARVFVTPHSTEPSALEATASTLLALHPAGGHVPTRDPEGKLALTADGRMVVESRDPDFLVFAVRRQGYGLDAERAPG